jgi:2-oxoglutarate ferredoxin oxidoreductase subunit delta
MVDKERCKGCLLCNEACPQKILSMSADINQKGYFFAYVSDPTRCIGCRICAITCPDVAIEIKIHGAQYHFFAY